MHRSKRNIYDGERGVLTEKCHNNPTKNLVKHCLKPVQNLVKISLKPSQNLIKISFKSGQNFSKVWSKPGQNIFKVWPKPGQNVLKVWLKPGQKISDKCNKKTKTKQKSNNQPPNYQSINNVKNNQGK